MLHRTRRRAALRLLEVLGVLGAAGVAANVLAPYTAAAERSTAWSAVAPTGVGTVHMDRSHAHPATIVVTKAVRVVKDFTRAR